MSALAAVQADGYYHPPDWDPRKESRKKYQKSRGSNQYEKYGVIRFELPYHCWCTGCERHLGRGTRFNAKKSKAGMYFTTTIWRFAMKCPTCPQKFVVETDPESRDFAFRIGIRRNEAHVEHMRPEQRTVTEGTLKLDTAATRQRIAVDPIFRLEKANDDKRIAAARSSTISRLEARSHANTADDYGRNRALRRTHRAQRAEAKQRLADGRAAGLPYALPAASDTARRVASAVGFRRITGGATRAAAVASARKRAGIGTLAEWDQCGEVVLRAFPGAVIVPRKKRKKEGDAERRSVRCGGDGRRAGEGMQTAPKRIRVRMAKGGQRAQVCR